MFSMRTHFRGNCRFVVRGAPELLLLFLCATLSEFPKLIIDRETVLADVSASVPTRKENMHVSYGTKRTQEVVKGLIYP